MKSETASPETRELVKAGYDLLLFVLKGIRTLESSHYFTVSLV
jgi:hypothetical protein